MCAGANKILLRRTRRCAAVDLLMKNGCLSVGDVEKRYRSDGSMDVLELPTLLDDIALLVTDLNIHRSRWKQTKGKQKKEVNDTVATLTVFLQ